MLLCLLLTGERPHRWTGQSPGELARQIEAGGGPLLGLLRRRAAPGVERRALRGDLERILSRALAPEPDRRYGSAAELAGDVERYLEGRPVTATPASAGYRLGKFVRRHRAGVAAAALVALSLAGGLLATLREARIADAERARAERRFADVRRLANVVLFDVPDALENVSGAMAARRLLVDNALRYLDDLAREAGDEPGLLAELAVAYERVGELQGMPGWPSEGRSGDALASFARALELHRRVRAPRRRRWTRRPRRGARARTSRVRARRPRRHRAPPWRGTARRWRCSSAPGPPRPRRRSGSSWRGRWSQSATTSGSSATSRRRPRATARPWRRRARRSPRAPDSTAAIRQVGVAEQRLGDAAAETGDWPRAVEHHAASLAVDRELARRAPDDAEIRRDLGTDLSRLGVAQLSAGAAAEALASHREAVRLRAALLAGDPLDARAGDDLAESRFEAGRALEALGRTAEAATEIAAAVEQRRALIARDPGNARWRDALASVLATRAEVEARRGDRVAAAATLAEALAIRRRLATESPDFASNRVALETLERGLVRRGLPAAAGPTRP